MARTGIVNISGVPQELPAPYRGELAPGAQAVIADTKTNVITNLGGDAMLVNIFSIVVLDDATATTFHDGGAASSLAGNGLVATAEKLLVQPVDTSVVVTSGGVQAEGLAVTGAGANVITGTKYLTAVGQNHAAAQVALCVCMRAGNVRLLTANLATAPSMGEAVVYTVQKSSDNGGTWSDTALTCTISGTAKAAQDATHSFAVAEGDMLAIKGVATANGGQLAAATTATLEIIF